MPVDQATARDWRFTKLAEQQRQGYAAVACVLSWYGRTDRLSTLSPTAMTTINALLVVDPTARSWVLPSLIA